VQRNATDGATLEGWCNEIEWTASTTKWDGCCNIGIMLQRDELLKRNGTVQQLWLVQRDGMDSQHDEMGWMVQHRNNVATR
jgi:hypothetical protein